MTKLLIVDDEPEVIEGISTLVDWKSHGIEICSFATNGEEALEKIRSLHPDIVLIDIKMPKLDGLQVIEYATKEGLRFESIILSGYDDFYFAQKAIELRSLNYLLKPCKPKEVLDAVLNAKSILEKQKEKEELINKFVEYYNETLPVLKERILNEVIFGIRNDKKELEQTFKKYDIRFASGKYCVVLARFDIEKVIDTHLESSIKQEAYTLACVNLIQEDLKDFRAEVFRGRNEIVIILNSDYEFDKETTNDLLLKIKRSIAEKLGLHLYFGIGKWIDEIRKINHSYTQALNALELKFFADEIDLLYYDDICITQSSILYPVEEEKAIINSLVLGQKDELNNKIEAFLNSLYNNNVLNKWFIKSAVLVLLGSVIKICYDKGIDLNDIANNRVFENILKTNKKESLKSSLVNLVHMIANKIEQSENKNPIVKAAVNYIEKNYNKNITLESVAKEVYVTPAYLSILFKRELKINFIDYLHKVRIQKAQELFENQNLKIYQVANMVGFTDEKYFSQIFKKYTGLTPTQYRESML
ncbi:response regulator [Thermoanaerobacter pentosaceus]|uniref:Stage 0 sporulation protein A homolog n=1 Tax=Thermoanaerobacter pentosaceus TaxID=694059 RepID=A0ABT9M1Z3_9THEO|nr:response regulator [Thermoanaerobacter pentosaceus]MDP9750149.1 two-component system response regulator YesN [Thermoanaerobacter pentosaceus]